ncbi:MAG: hypothetical protein M3Y13_00415 [Armatimonadota bacterium]|nr:hypothetical protein [Armatimonadota bacterium]
MSQTQSHRQVRLNGWDFIILGGIIAFTVFSCLEPDLFVKHFLITRGGAHIPVNTWDNAPFVMRLITLLTAPALFTGAWFYERFIRPFRPNVPQATPGYYPGLNRYNSWSGPYPWIDTHDPETRAKPCRILVLQGIVPEREQFFPPNFLPGLVAHLQQEHYDHVILTVFEPGAREYEELKPFVASRQEWRIYPAGARGYDQESIPIDIDGGKYFAIVHDWIRQLKGQRVTLVGDASDKEFRGLQRTLYEMNISYKEGIEIVPR